MNDELRQLLRAAERDALAAEEAGRLTGSVVDAALRAGVFDYRIPTEFGGHGAGLVDQLELSEAISYADGGAGWTLSFMALSGALVAAHVPADGAAEIGKGGRWPRFAGTFPFSGIATPIDGGFAVRGRWGFASGIHHAEWVAAGCRVAGSESMVWIAVPAAEAVIDASSWNTDGLRSTGSCSYELRDVEVPASRCFSVVAGRAPARAPVGHLPTLVFISPEHAGVALGLARRALAEVRGLADGKLRMGGRLALGSREAFLRDLGRADTQLSAARALLVERLRTADATDGPIDPRLTSGVRAAASHLADVATEVATLAYRYGGGSAINRTHQLHRAWRDVHTATQHVHTNDENYVAWAEASVAEGR